ncbi:MAG: TonB-dependent receptor [Gemmatimonadales bacterium]|nr:MAG: TonB-dependent receptor [Gemmatimonadales bacterium]
MAALCRRHRHLTHPMRPSWAAWDADEGTSMARASRRSRISRGWLLLVVSVSIPSVAAARAAPDSTRVYLLDPIVVTATRVEALRSRVPNAISVLTKADLRSSGETSVLPLIGRRVPGVFVTERGVLGYGVSNGAAGSIMIRGAGGSPNTEVLMLTDGRPQMMGLMGHPLADTYLTSGVERVEIIRGPASLLYGTNAMGGVVNIIYETPTTPGMKTEAGSSRGSFGTEKYEAAGTYGAGRGGFSLSAGRDRTDGHRPYSSFDSDHGSLRGAVALSPQYSLNADVRVTGFQTYDPGPASAPALDHWVDITRGSSGATLTNHHANTQGALQAFFNWGRHDLYDGFHSTDRNVGVALHQALRVLPGNTTTLGMESMRYGGVAENRKTHLDYGAHFVNEQSGYVLVQQKLRGKLDANAGLRLNHHSGYGWETVPQAGLTFQAGPQTTFKASVSKGFRSPTIRELYLFPAPTPTLRPERMLNYEVGWLQRIGSAVSFEATGFLAEGSNLIRTTGAWPALKLGNSGRFTHRGLECSGRITPARDLDLDLTYGYLEPGDQTNANPRHKVHAGGTWRIRPVTVNLGAQYVGRLYGDDFRRKPLPDYALVGARVEAEVLPGASFYLAGENLLNRQYQVLSGYPMPGRTLFAGMRWAQR